MQASRLPEGRGKLNVSFIDCISVGGARETAGTSYEILLKKRIKAIKLNFEALLFLLPQDIKRMLISRNRPGYKLSFRQIVQMKNLFLPFIAFVILPSSLSRPFAESNSFK